MWPRTRATSITPWNGNSLTAIDLADQREVRRPDHRERPAGGLAAFLATRHPRVCRCGSQALEGRHCGGRGIPGSSICIVAFAQDGSARARRRSLMQEAMALGADVVGDRGSAAGDAAHVEFCFDRPGRRRLHAADDVKIRTCDAGSGERGDPSRLRAARRPHAAISSIRSRCLRAGRSAARARRRQRPHRPARRGQARLSRPIQRVLARTHLGCPSIGATHARGRIPRGASPDDHACRDRQAQLMAASW